MEFNPDVVSIEVSVAPSPEDEALSFFEAGFEPTAERVDKFTPNPKQVARAKDELTKMGFRVLMATDMSISIEGSPNLFSKVFGTELTTNYFEDLAVPATPAVDSFFAPAAEASWEPPSPLEGVIERAYIQEPYLYFENPIPPRVNYHHLRAPIDLQILLNASHVHRQGHTGKGVKVAMVDSGFYIDHPFYKDSGYNLSRILAKDAHDIDHDEKGHGTAEAANLLAIAPDIDFIGIKAGPNLALAFKEAVKNNPNIITISMGWDIREPRDVTNGLPRADLPNRLKTLEVEIAHAVASGITVIFAAGNGQIAFPGMHPDVISAGGTYVGADMTMRASDYASAFESVIYPGRNVPDLTGLVGLFENKAAYIMLPLEPDCKIDNHNDGTAPDDGWCVISGTSAAAPQIAGVCALLKQKNPGLSPADIKSVILRTARDVTTGEANKHSNPVKSGSKVKHVPIQASKGPDGATGYGLIDAYAAWKQV
ncbi:MAG: S8 family serine peptidase [Desulfobacteraceae bacterium]|nr:S8 family serine peptidase [Desulfobacteraceae bacterium]